ncbi:MAG: PAC2 family protein [Planctomycetota bacterium]|jgi:proteasome assembly chaperone (PAC2) family protein
MAEIPKLNKPWMVAVWPGMGHVAITAGYYLMAKLQMYELAEFPSNEVFDIEHIEIRDGLVKAARRPRSRFFLWPHPRKKRDIVLFIGEAQPSTAKYEFCHRLLDYAEKMGVEHIFTFAAMVTNMLPKGDSRTYGIATDEKGVKELKRLELLLMKEGQIAGLNGVLLAAVKERGMRGTGLLGEMPGFAPQVPYPKASKAVLQIFAAMGGFELDFRELDQYGASMQKQLSDLLKKMQDAVRDRIEDKPEPGQETFQQVSFTPQEEEPQEQEPPRLSDKDRARIDKLFKEARRDRSKTFELKQELDRLDVFKEYEDRFLDLFRKQD